MRESDSTRTLKKMPLLRTECQVDSSAGEATLFSLLTNLARRSHDGEQMIHNDFCHFDVGGSELCSFVHLFAVATRPMRHCFK